MTVREDARVVRDVEVPFNGRGKPFGKWRGRAHAYNVCLWPPVNRGL